MKTQRTIKFNETLKNQRETLNFKSPNKPTLQVIAQMIQFVLYTHLALH